MLVIAFFCIFPFLLAAIAEYLVCRLLKRPVWKLAPPLLGLLTCAALAVGRARIWTSEQVTPYTQLLLFPGLPALFMALGFFAGWRLWRRLWLPRVIDEG